MIGEVAKMQEGLMIIMMMGSYITKAALPYRQKTALSCKWVRSWVNFDKKSLLKQRPARRPDLEQENDMMDYYDYIISSAGT